jgi:hypothetical protein
MAFFECSKGVCGIEGGIKTILTSPHTVISAWRLGEESHWLWAWQAVFLLSQPVKLYVTDSVSWTAAHVPLHALAALLHLQGTQPIARMWSSCTYGLHHTFPAPAARSLCRFWVHPDPFCQRWGGGLASFLITSLFPLLKPACLHLLTASGPIKNLGFGIYLFKDCPLSITY